MQTGSEGLHRPHRYPEPSCHFNVIFQNDEQQTFGEMPNEIHAFLTGRKNTSFYLHDNCILDKFTIIKITQKYIVPMCSVGPFKVHVDVEMTFYRSGLSGVSEDI